MARDERGRFLPGYDPASEEEDDGRHVLSREERRKGYLVATRLAKMPSRLRSWLRKKIGRHYGRGVQK